MTTGNIWTVGSKLLALAGYLRNIPYRNTSSMRFMKCLVLCFLIVVFLFDIIYCIKLKSLLACCLVIDIQIRMTLF